MASVYHGRGRASRSTQRLGRSRYLVFGMLLASFTSSALATAIDNPSQIVPRDEPSLDNPSVPLDIPQVVSHGKSWAHFASHMEYHNRRTNKDEDEDELSNSNDDNDSDEDEDDNHRGHGSSDDGEPTEDSDNKSKAKTDAQTTTEDTSHRGQHTTAAPTRTTETVATTPVVQPSSTPVDLSAPLPSPFDNTPSSQFKIADEDDSCPNFISNLLSDPKFQGCYPLSMMLETSLGLFNAEKELLSIVRVLDATCKVDSSSCADYMISAAQNMSSSDNCAAEYEAGQVNVLRAYRGLMAYKAIYAASCLQDPDTDTYCFASAVTNTTNPSDIYLYSLPYNSTLPGSSRLSCNWCTKQTLGIFHASSADRNLLISNTYEGAADQVNTLCGPSWVNATLPEAQVASASTSNDHWTAMAIASVLTIASLHYF